MPRRKTPAEKAIDMLTKIHTLVTTDVSGVLYDIRVRELLNTLSIDVNNMYTTMNTTMYTTMNTNQIQQKCDDTTLGNIAIAIACARNVVGEVLFSPNDIVQMIQDSHGIVTLTKYTYNKNNVALDGIAVEVGADTVVGYICDVHTKNIDLLSLIDGRKVKAQIVKCDGIYQKSLRLSILLEQLSA